MNKAVPATAEEVNEFIRSNPEAVLKVMEGRRMRLSELFPGDANQGIRRAVMDSGRYRGRHNEVKFQTRPIPGEDDHEIIAIAAVSFNPGPTVDFIGEIDDFLSSAPRNKISEVQELWTIYKVEGMINNAVNKIAAILSGGGSYKVRRTKLGRKADALDKLREILYEFQRRVNASAADATVTGARGLQAVTHQGVRRALVEGDWIARTVWVNHDVPEFGTASLPMVIQSISTRYLIPISQEVPGLSEQGLEGFYWRPPQNFVEQLKKPASKDVARILKEFVPKDLQGPLKKDGQVFLDPALLLRVKHRGVDTDTWGESFITPALQAIAFKRAIDQLDFSTMRNIINRLTIIMVGSADPTSPYSKSDVAIARAQLMQSFFEEPGPNMTIVWAGDDVKVEDVGSENEVLELDGRHKIAESKIKNSLGVPDALLSGTTDDGKAAGWAATIGTSSQLEELQNGFAQMWSQLGERIAIENGFEQTDLVFEFDKSLMVDRLEELNQSRADYSAGLTSIYDVLVSRDKDPDAVFLRRCLEKGLDPANTTWEEAFMPPQGLQGQATVDAPNEPGRGRQPNNEKGQPTTKERETPPTTRENK